MIARSLLIILISLTLHTTAAQELKCVVDVNTSQLQGTNKAIFESLSEAIEAYLNTTKFSNTQISSAERIDCRLLLTVTGYNNDRVSGDMQIQSSRPVYNSSYNTPMFNFRDQNIEFEYREGDPLIYSEQENSSNLTAILDFYAFMIMAIDFDSFSPSGGSVFYEKAAVIVQRAQSSGETGWRTFEDSKNRSALLNAFSETPAMRSLIYNYHRLGLDIMNVSPDKGRAAIVESLHNLDKIYQTQPMSVGLTIFKDSKLDELVNVFSKSSADERKFLVTLLSKIYPTEQDRIDQIKNSGSSSH